MGGILPFLVDRWMSGAPPEAGVHRGSSRRSRRWKRPAYRAAPSHSSQQLPAVNTDLMLQEMLSKIAAKVGHVVYWGRPLDWHN